MVETFVKSEKWQVMLADLIKTLQQPEFPATYLKAIEEIVGFDSAVIMAYGMETRPKILLDQLALEYRDAFYNRYLKGAFLLSPLYRTFRSGKQGFFHIKNLAPDGFFNSEYYNKYYMYSGLIDQFFYLKRFHEGFAIVVSIARTKNCRAFSRSELNGLKLLESVLISLIEKNWEHLANEKYSFSDHLYRAFENFGTSVLSKREKEVANCILRGASSKSAAREMDITVETERSYRKTVYQKMDVRSHAELFSLFFRSLAFAEHTDDQDPLVLLRKTEKPSRPPHPSVTLALQKLY